MRKIALRALRAAGFSIGCVYEANDGLHGLDLLETKQVDFVVTDLHMPVMDGLEMIRRIRASKLRAFIPVLVLTSEGQTERVKELGRLGAMIVRKPFTAEQFKTVLHRVAPLVDRGAPVSRDAIFAVGRRVLETLAFAGVVEGVEANVDSYRGAVSATIQFTGLWSGYVVVTSNRTTLAALVKNMLGHADGSAMEAEDILREITNVVAGDLVQELFGVRTEVKLGLPCVQPTPAPMDYSSEEPASSARLLLDEGWVEVGVVRGTLAHVAAEDAAGEQGGKEIA